MANWQNLARSLALADGVIGERETQIIKNALMADKVIDRAEMEFLLQVRRQARSVASSFTEFVNEVIKRAILKDRSVNAAEATWLRQQMFADGKISGDEKQLLSELRNEAREVCQEFTALYEECLKP